MSENWRVEYEQAVAERNKLIAEVERLNLQLAACGVAALANTPESAAKQRIGKDNPYWSASYEDVCRAVDSEMALRSEVERLKSENARLVNEIYVLKGLVENANEKTASERMAKTLALSENVALQEGAANMGRINCERHAEITVLKEQLAAKDAEIDALTNELETIKNSLRECRDMEKNPNGK